MTDIEEVELHAGSPTFKYKAVRKIEARCDLGLLKGAPTFEAVNDRLKEVAAKAGANAVIDVRYKRGVTLHSFDSIHATGIAVVRPVDIACPSCAETIKRQAKRCRFCGHELPVEPALDGPPMVEELPPPTVKAAAPARAKSGSRWKTWQLVLVSVLALFVLLVIVAGIAAEAERKADPAAYARRQAERPKSDEQRERSKQAAALAAEKLEKDKIAAAEAAVDKDRASGFHCLSGWDGSNRSTVDQVKEKLRDPDSFEHMETRIAPASGDVNALMMTYRARNGFGGMNVEHVMATVNNTTCASTIVLQGDGPGS